MRRKAIIGLVVLFVLAVGYGVWSFIDFYSLRHHIEVGIVLDPNPGKYTLHLSLPKGPYRVVARLQEAPENDSDAGRIRYALKIPRQKIDVDKEAPINWHLRVAENRLFSSSFKIREHGTDGTLLVEVLQPTRKRFWVGVVSARELDM